MFLSLISLGLLAVTFFAKNADSRPSEEERVRLWYERNNTWPPKWQPVSDKLKKVLLDRDREMQMIPGADERWENYMQSTIPWMVPRFTERGFDIVDTPPVIQEKLKRYLDDALQRWNNTREEKKVEVLYTPIPSKFIDLPRSELFEIQEYLRPIHEEWAGGMELEATSIYGIRSNRNGSSLVMHYDKIETHVISSIIHIDHDYFDDNEPWPIEIEDHDGELHAFNLAPGQMLFYESAACLHGRRKILKGNHYSSIFNHYRPVDPNIWDFSIDEVIANVPPHWKNGIIEDHGSRWSGQGLTIDSRMTEGAPPRIIKGQLVTDIADYYSKLEL